MELKIIRKYKKPDYTIGDLYVNNIWFCNTLEDADRGLLQTDSILTINSKKVANSTAIPLGKYELSLNTVSPKYYKIPKYKSILGKIPRLLNVPGFNGVLIHSGNTSRDTGGCILVGYNKIKGALTESTVTFFNLYKILKKAKDNNENINITII